jgi:uncharacterized repeat protein (TIGR03803 family)
MKLQTGPTPVRFLMSLLFGTALCAGLATTQAQTFSVIYRFTGGTDGGGPYGPLAFDQFGNIYGITFQGADAGCYGGCGAVFELTHGSGGWTESTVHDFTGGTDGGAPLGGLIFDSVGNLYGTTQVGGIACGHEFGCGVAFEMTKGSGGWNESVLYSFRTIDGYYPGAGLTFDKGAHLYGTTPNGGSGDGGGTVFELSQGKDGWKDNTLHSFSGVHDGSEPPPGAVILDAAGNLYGTTSGGGGQFQNGTVYELVSGSRKERILYGFRCGSDGCNPFGGLVFGKSENAYGTTRNGGISDQGTVFKIARTSRGKWKESVIYRFKGGSDGTQPFSTLLFDNTGNLYGTTYSGGDPSCSPPVGCGTVFKLTPASGGRWKETVLYRFKGGGDGFGPAYGSLALDSKGNLYGTAALGGNAGCGNFGCGVVFEITPKEATHPFTLSTGKRPLPYRP